MSVALIGVELATIVVLKSYVLFSDLIIGNCGLKNFLLSRKSQTVFVVKKVRRRRDVFLIFNNVKQEGVLLFLDLFD